MKDYNKEYQKGLILRLMKIEQDNLKKVGELVLEGVKTASMAFSIDGSLFAFYLKEKQQLRIFKIKNIEDIINQIIHNDSILSYTGIKAGKKAIGFIRDIDFDEGMRFLVGRGDKEVVILNIASSEPRFYKLDEIKYERILTVRLRSTSNQ